MHLCPACKEPTVFIHPKLARCPNDGLLTYINAKEHIYAHDYFDREYSAQYGRSYVDDKPNIRKRMLWRLNKAIQHIQLFEVGSTAGSAGLDKTGKGKRLLEIGSAAGFFIQLATEYGFEALGWELSGFASDYARKQNCPTLTGDFFSLYDDWQKQKNNTFDVLAAFYTIEHFADQNKFWQAANQLVAKRGWLVLSLPSTLGPSFFFHFDKWMASHPADHFVDYNPSSLQRVASQFGFTMVASYSEGVHPERFPLGGIFGFSHCYKVLQSHLPFSDTFYAILRKQR